MSLRLILTLALAFTSFARGEGESEITDEDRQVLAESVAKYGSPIDYNTLNLPGPEFVADYNILMYPSKVVPGDQPGSLTMKLRTVTEYFSYNGRYEETEIKKIGKQEIPIVKGQFGEHFERKNGGFYVRSIGYTLDENGYNQFLIDVTTANTTITIVGIHVISGGHGHKPPSHKKTISSTVLISLTGGNLG